MNVDHGALQIRCKREWTFWRILLLPFVAVWNLVTGIMKLIGRIVLLVIGLVMMIVGGLFTMTVIGAFVGLPLAALGLLLVLRSLF